MTITVLARAQSGEVFFTRDDSPASGPRYYLHRRYAPGDPVEISLARVEHAIATQGYDVVDRDFATWAEVECFIDETMPRITTADANDMINPASAPQAIGQMRKWLADDNKRQLITPLVTRYLRVPDVQADGILMGELADLLDAADTRHAPIPRIAEGSSDRVAMFRSFFAFRATA